MRIGCRGRDYCGGYSHKKMLRLTVHTYAKAIKKNEHQD